MSAQRKTLYISEKPSVGRELAAVLADRWTSGDGFMESDEHVIAWAQGHLLELAEPDAYDPKLKRWRMADLPIIPRKFQLKPIHGRGKQLAQLKKLIGRRDISEIVNACDAGREGELIFAWILQHAGGTSKPVRRLWLSSMTPQAIRQALSELKDGEEMSSLEQAARARAAADWLVGINGTRAASIRFRPVFDSSSSLGRVQTPTLAILVAREKQIQAFQSEPRWAIHAEFMAANKSRYEARWYRETPAAPASSDQNVEANKPHAEESEAARKGREQKAQYLPSEQEAKRVLSQITSSRPDTRELFELREELTSEPAPLLYDLTALQRDANKRFKWPAKKTLELCQELYERFKAVTYPRTDSRYLQDEMAAEIEKLRVFLNGCETYRPLTDELPDGPLTPTHPGRVYDAAKVTDHHAILPTAEPAFASVFSDMKTDPASALSADQFKLYDLIVKRTLAVFFPDASYRTLRARTRTGEADRRHLFLTTGKGLIEPGWLQVYGKRPEPGKVPSLVEGRVMLMGAKIVKSESKPPKRHTEGTLLQAMAAAGREVSDEGMREAMKERGLGTPATRAQIIERLIKVSYVKRSRGELQPTQKGIDLIDYLGGGKLVSPELTGEWEHRLRQIEAGAGDTRAFWSDIVRFCAETVDEIKTVELPAGAVKPPELGEQLGVCPGCGQPIRETPRAFSCWAGAEQPGCGFAVWKQIAGRTITPPEAQELLQRGRVGPFSGFYSERTRNHFTAALVIADGHDGGKTVRFEFQPAPMPAATKETQKAPAAA